jgi:hypothetical protein
MLPGGELVHRDVNADDRSLPKRIPANVTALMDLASRDVELYCALPFRVISKAAPPTGARPTPTVTETPSAPTLSPTPDMVSTATAPNPVAGRMGTIGMDSVGAAPPPAESQPKAPANKDEEEAPPAPKPSAGLPWE